MIERTVIQRLSRLPNWRHTSHSIAKRWVRSRIGPNIRQRKCATPILLPLLLLALLPAYRCLLLALSAAAKLFFLRLHTGHPLLFHPNLTLHLATAQA